MLESAALTPDPTSSVGDCAGFHSRRVARQAGLMPRAALPLTLTALLACGGTGDQPIREHNVPIEMRDGVILRANVWRPPGNGRFPVLLYRTPYGKDFAEGDYSTHRRAVERGYAVVLQDVRGRYASEGEFYPYRNEGRDGYDTIEWAARQPWSNGLVGTYGLSYPGAVQWLAAIESPPHLEAMVPAMTFSTPTNFFYSGGVFDASWIPWITINIAPDLRRRTGVAGARTGEEAAAEWRQKRDEIQRRLPLDNLPELREVAPFYFEWLEHPPTDPWWEWIEIRGKYERVRAAVLNLSGWYDEAYGPEVAATNFNGLVTARMQDSDLRTRLIIGPWVHGVQETGRARTGDLDFGEAAAIDYDEVVLRWMDRYLKGIENGIDLEEPVRIFVMGKNRWKKEQSWPPAGAETLSLYLSGAGGESRIGRLDSSPPEAASAPSTIDSDPTEPVADPYRAFGPHDYRDLAGHDAVRVFDTDPLPEDLEVTGTITAEIYVSCDCPDTDLWVRLLDVAPDGSAFNLMSPGLDVQRASYRDPDQGRLLLEPGRIYRLRLDRLMTSNVFRKGHRIRAQISTSFFPHFSRNLHSGELETHSGVTRRAEIRIHHDAANPSRLLLPVVGRQPATRKHR
jgi:putative CocE/NonD family hydrolase